MVILRYTLINERIFMFKKYSQSLVDDLFDEGDRDCHFLHEFFGFAGNIYPEPYMKNRIDLHKTQTQELDDALLLATFFIESKAYVGFYMKEYGKFDRTFDNPKEFEDFIKKSIANDSNYLERITGEDRYTVGLKKIEFGAKAPPVTFEIDKIFR